MGHKKMIKRQDLQTLSLSHTHTPHLEQILGTVYLIIGANYCDDTIFGSFIWVSNGHRCTRLLTNLLDS